MPLVSNMSPCGSFTSDMNSCAHYCCQYMYVLSLFLATNEQYGNQPCVKISVRLSGEYNDIKILFMPTYMCCCHSIWNKRPGWEMDKHNYSGAKEGRRESCETGKCF